MIESRNNCHAVNVIFVAIVGEIVAIADKVNLDVVVVTVIVVVVVVVVIITSWPSSSPSSHMPWLLSMPFLLPAAICAKLYVLQCAT